MKDPLFITKEGWLALGVIALTLLVNEQFPRTDIMRFFVCMTGFAIVLSIAYSYYNK